MLPARPYVPSQPCPTCGQEVDPLRAARVVWLEDGARFLCSKRCQARFLDGERNFDTRSLRPVERPQGGRPSIPDLVREATTVREAGKAARADSSRDRRQDAVAAIVVGVAALALLLFTRRPEVGWLSACLVLVGAALNARLPLTALRVPPPLRLVAPIGLALAAMAALLTPGQEAQRWSLLGAALATIIVSVRNSVHGALASPLRTAARELRQTLPEKARVPSHGALAYEEVSAASLRQGEVMVVLEGELVPADGVIEEGSGLALRYPKAVHSRPFVEGDFVLAGTRMLEGAVTVRARRTGSQRGVVRALDLGWHTRQERTGGSTLQLTISQWSWLVLGPAALAALAWTGPAGAATFLLGVPVLAIFASLHIPLDAGALASARRGMFFGRPRTLRDAGRTATTAILLRGALTASEPIVQRVQSLGSTNLSRVIALAAAAENAAQDHPIARAIRRYATENGYASVAVRKERLRPGLGVTAVTWHGVPLVVGRRQLLLNEGISVATADSDATYIENQGLTPIFIALDGRLEALLAILDPLHVGARDAVQRISDLPCEVVILSGDDRRAVERIAAQLGAPRVKAPLLPHERVTEVQALRETGGVLAAIGRAGEDDAVLAAADIPISLRLAGSALEDRGVVIASHDVRDAAGALWVARAVRRATWRSLGTCILMTALVALGAAFGWMTPVGAALLGLGAEAWALRAGSRLLRRVDLRVPMQQ